eukprot:gb/GECG01003539.1/.p1 GENE.gb/GECG01003539.1/~~gb/GECG01003539.1/.p1  ORF type:complete len:298 (+),score=15.64 gb/GECG01003539.1/:1-894(+)
MSISLTDFSWVNEIASDDAIQQLSWGETPTLQGPWDQDKLYAWYNYLMDDRVYVDDLDAKRFIAFDKWKNDVLLPQFAVEMLPHFFASWARNLIAATLLYHGVGLIWSLWIYVLNGKKYFPKNDIPTLSTIWQQMKVSQLAILWYTFLPAVDEWFVERGFGMAYYSVPEFGWWRYLAFTAVYLVWVEFGIYWVHRLLHEIKWAYRWLHHDHHIYNTKDTLSPFGKTDISAFFGLTTLACVWQPFSCSGVGVPSVRWNFTGLTVCCRDILYSLQFLDTPINAILHGHLDCEHPRLYPN